MESICQFFFVGKASVPSYRLDFVKVRTHMVIILHHYAKRVCFFLKIVLSLECNEVMKNRERVNE